MNFYITLNLYPDGDGYHIEADANLPDEELILKVLKDTVDSWGRRSSKGFD